MEDGKGGNPGSNHFALKVEKMAQYSQWCHTSTRARVQGPKPK